MAREIDKLKSADVESITEKGLHGDGGNLFLQVRHREQPGSSEPAITKSWLFRYRIGGRKTPRDIGLGGADRVSLALARQKAADLRKLLAQDIDPWEQKRAAQAASTAEADGKKTFRKWSAEYIAHHRAEWTSEKHARQWESTLATYAFPQIGQLSVADITKEHVERVLLPIWIGKHATASRLRRRIESILSWATDKDPAHWRANRKTKLQSAKAIRKLRPTRHHAAMPYQELPAFWERLRREQHGVASLALQFAILTGARAAEASQCRWREIDFRTAVWTVPAERMKARRVHRVPLSPQAVQVLRQIPTCGAPDDAPVFRSYRNRPLSGCGLLALLRRMGLTITTHGFRSTLSTWAAERTNYPRAVCELALAHDTRTETEAAYQRSDLLERRRPLMADWARFVTTKRPAKGAKIVSLHGQQAAAE